MGIGTKAGEIGRVVGSPAEVRHAAPSADAPTGLAAETITGAAHSAISSGLGMVANNSCAMGEMKLTESNDVGQRLRSDTPCQAAHAPLRLTCPEMPIGSPMIPGLGTLMVTSSFVSLMPGGYPVN